MIIFPGSSGIHAFVDPYIFTVDSCINLLMFVMIWIYIYIYIYVCILYIYIQSIL